MGVHDGVVESRRRLVAVIERSTNVRRACRQAGIHHSTFYRWRKQLVSPPVRAPRRWGDRVTERVVVAEALARPESGPRMLEFRLSERGIGVSASTIWRILCRHRLNTRQLRYQLLTLHHTEAPMAVTPKLRWIGALDASVPGDLVQMDCFHVGSFKETRLGVAKSPKGVIWQYTAIDVASSWTWAELHATAHNPSPVLTSALAHRVAADLASWGWTPRAVSTDNGNEFRSQQFTDTLTELGINHRFIKAGRPQSNGKVERVQGTILQECYQPALIGYVEPSITGLRQDLDRYLEFYNHQRPHHGKWNKGQPPVNIIRPATKLTP